MRRNRYYQGKYLTSETFRTEQDYYNEKISLLTNIVFDKVIIKGLDVTASFSDTVCVAPGIASDGHGNLIHVVADTELPLRTLRGYMFQNELTLYICYNEKSDTDYIEEQALFSLVKDDGAVPIADIVMNCGSIVSVRSYQKKVSSTLSRLLNIDKRDIEEMKGRIACLSKRLGDAMSYIFRRLGKSDIKEKTVPIVCTADKLLFSEKLFFERGNEPYFAVCGLETDNGGLVYGDTNLFKAQDTDIKIVRKAVRIMRDDGYLQIAVELEAPAPGRTIILRLVTIGADRNVNDFRFDNID